MKMNEVGGVLVTATPQEIVVDSRIVSFLHTGKADSAGTASTAVIFLSFNGNIFNASALYQAREGYTWLTPGISFQHDRKATSIWVRTDSGAAILMVSPENMVGGA